MLRSFLAPASHGQVVLRREILSHIGIGANGILYGALYPEERALILSSIPPSSWQNAYKVIIHTEDLFGSLAKAANAIATLNINTISSWASTESHDGHLCSTSIVVIDNKTMADNGGLEGTTEQLITLLGDRRSKLRTFGKDRLLSVRVTPLLILRAYQKELTEATFFTVEITDHFLRLHPQSSTAMNSPWKRLLQASLISNSSACILTPDTEEAFLRVTAVPESARLYSLSFLLSIQSNNRSFAGYWTNALNLLAHWKYSIYVAHNLLTKKSEVPPIEQAEFRFVVDYGSSDDIGTPQGELEEIWRNRLNESFGALAGGRSDTASITALRLSRPRGAGVPCFFATNAKPKSGVASDTAIKLCRKLEGFGFKPVNVDFARGNMALEPQVTRLVEACRFMVVLNCPEERLRIDDNKYRVSEWVLFEEVLMAAHHGEILSVRFADVRRPAYRQGFVEIEIPETGITEEKLEDFGDRLQNWTPLMFVLDADNVHAPEIPEDILAKDLVAYYSGR
jgi:hypothetical protein